MLIDGVMLIILRYIYRSHQSTVHQQHVPSSLELNFRAPSIPSDNVLQLAATVYNSPRPSNDTLPDNLFLLIIHIRLATSPYLIHLAFLDSLVAAKESAPAA